MDIDINTIDSEISEIPHVDVHEEKETRTPEGK